MPVFRSSRFTTGLLLGGAALGAAAAVGYAVYLRPRHLRWGATDDEVKGPWPGDDVAPQASSICTHAITIDAAADKVWPWIAQLGQDRAGFYSYAWLENLVGAEITNADRIVPEFQGRSVGDTVWLAPKHRYGGEGRMLVAELDPGKSMVLVSPKDFDKLIQGQRAAGTWSFILNPLEDGKTRLIVRGRDTWEKLSGRVFNATVFEPAHFIMERKMLVSIKRLAEAYARTVAEQVAEVPVAAR